MQNNWIEVWHKQAVLTSSHSTMTLFLPRAFSCRNWRLIIATLSKTKIVWHDSPFSWWQQWHFSCTWHLITESTGHHCAKMLMTFSTCHSSVSVTHEFLLHSSALRQPLQHEKHLHLSTNIERDLRQTCDYSNTKHFGLPHCHWQRWWECLSYSVLTAISEKQTYIGINIRHKKVTFLPFKCLLTKIY